ncbi:hypothetical protein D3C86_1703010 [compost metagenome]
MVRGLGCMGGVLGDVLGGSSHFLDCCGNQIDSGHLFLHPAVCSYSDVGRVFRRVADLLYRIDHLADHHLQLAEECIEASCDRSGLISPAADQSACQVAFALSNIIEHRDHLAQRLRDPPTHPPHD